MVLKNRTVLFYFLEPYTEERVGQIFDVHTFLLSVDFIKIVTLFPK